LNTLINELLTAALKWSEQIPRPSARTTALIQIARAFWANQEKEKSLQTLAQALKMIEVIKMPFEKAGQLSWIARAFAEIGEKGIARKEFERATLLARAAEIPAARDALLDIALEYKEAGWQQAAERILNELEDILPENCGDRAFLLLSLSEIYLEIKSREKALGLLKKAQIEASKIQDTWFRIERMLDVAENLAEAGETVTGNQILGQIEAELPSLAEVSRPYFLFRMAAVYRRGGEIQKAREILVSLPDKIREDEASVRVESLLSAAEEYLDLGEEQESVKLLELILQEIYQVENLKDRALLQLRVAELYQFLNRLPEATRLAERVLEVCEEIKDNRGKTYLLASLAVFYFKAGQREKGSKIIGLIEKLIEQRSTGTTGLGEIALDLAENGEFFPALQITSLIREPHIRIEALTGICRTLLAAGSPPTEDIEKIAKEISTLP